MGSLQGRSAVVVFTNGFNGMSIMPELVDGILPGCPPCLSLAELPQVSQRLKSGSRR